MPDRWALTRGNSGDTLFLKVGMEPSSIVNRSEYYKILGVSPNASEQEIKSAYRRLAREVHPDVNPGDVEAEERFKQINEAYNALSFGNVPERGGNGGDGSPWTTVVTEPDSYFSWANAQDAAWAAHNSDMGFAELFQSVYGGGQVPMSPFPDMDDAFSRWHHEKTSVLPDVTLTIEESFTGVRKINADGLTLDIPPGAFDGAFITASDGRSARIRLVPHGVFQPSALDLYCEIPLHPRDAETGIPIALPTLYGEAAITLPPGVPHNEFLRLEGLGLPGTFSGSPPGHLFLHIVHDTEMVQGAPGPIRPYRWGNN